MEITRLNWENNAVNGCEGLFHTLFWSSLSPKVVQRPTILYIRVSWQIFEVFFISPILTLQEETVIFVTLSCFIVALSRTAVYSGYYAPAVGGICKKSNPFIFFFPSAGRFGALWPVILNLSKVTAAHLLGRTALSVAASRSNTLLCGAKRAVSQCELFTTWVHCKMAQRRVMFDYCWNVHRLAGICNWQIIALGFRSDHILA